MATLDWAAASEADEESRLALMKRAVKLEPSNSLPILTTEKKVRKKSTTKADKKSTPSLKNSGSSLPSPSPVKHDENAADMIGSSAWVVKEMEAVGLNKYVQRLETQIPLELLVHVEPTQLDQLLRHSKTEAWPDVIDYVKLQAVIRSMQVKVSGTTGPLKSRGNASAPGATSPSASSASLTSTDTSSSPTSTPSKSKVASTATSAQDVRTLLQGDILLWDVSAVQAWMHSVPALHPFKGAFEHNQIDGHRLLRLNDRKLLQRLQMESDSDRQLILQHVSDLKALQLTHAASAHSHILNKLIEGLAAELAQLNKISSNPTTSLLASKRVPNYFLSLRIGCPELRQKVKQIQAEIENLIPDLAGSRSMLPPEQLHFTLGRLHLQTDAEIAQAKRLLDECYNVVYKQLYGGEGQQVAVNFRGVMSYGGNTVFLETERGTERDLLIEFGNTVYDIFQTAGLTSKEFRFQPVAPIIRVRQSKKSLVTRLQEVSNTYLQSYANSSLGRNVFVSLDISAVADETDSDGYYKTLHAVTLH